MKLLNLDVFERFSMRHIGRCYLVNWFACQLSPARDDALMASSDKLLHSRRRHVNLVFPPFVTARTELGMLLMV